MNKVDKIKFVTSLDEYKTFLNKISICNTYDFKNFLIEQWNYYKSQLELYLSKKEKFDNYIIFYNKICLKDQLIEQKKILEIKLELVNKKIDLCNKHIDFYKKKTENTPQQKLVILNRLLHNFTNKIRDNCISFLSLDGKKKNLELLENDSHKYLLLKEIIEIEDKIEKIKGYILTDNNNEKIKTYEKEEIKNIIYNSNNELYELVVNNI